jgi:hypothetical protein
LFSGLDYAGNSGRAVHDPAVHLEGRTVPSRGELAGLAGGSGRVLRHHRKALALVLCAGDRDLPASRACLAAPRLGHAAGFLPASDERLPARQPGFAVPAPGPGTGLGGPGCRPAAEPAAGTTVLRRGSLLAGEIYLGMASLPGTPGSAGSPETVRLPYSGLAGGTAAVVGAQGITAAGRTPATLGSWLARYANCPAGQR